MVPRIKVGLENKMSEGRSFPVQGLPVNPFAGLQEHKHRFPYVEQKTRRREQGARIQTLPDVRPDQIVKVFNTWAFKREQPNSLVRIEKATAKAVAEQRALSFVLYWGKGPRNNIAASDLVCLDYLASLAARVQQVYAAGASFHLILTDTHAELNGHPQEAQDTYFCAITEAAALRGFTASRLSAAVAVAKPKIDMSTLGEPASEVRESLLACAAKWFRGEGSVEQGALEYYRMNMIEKRAVENAFPDAIFVTFNGSEFRDLFPEAMPIFYMYSLRRGFSVKPWFIDHESDVLLKAS